ncbi:MAG: carboxypeptidase-like regulatory domain-containing protein [Candidatus Obscuribacterales bacterium]|nr:carboxypeptidase-like regulatory domain-containing protein [Candidatus Obscuribacterales bacterium]
MKRLLQFVLVIALVGPAVQAAAPPQPGPGNPCLLQPPATDLVVDVNNLPAKIELTLGQSVVFVRKNLTLNTGVRINHSTSGFATDPLEKLNTATVVRPGYQVLGVFQAKNEGKGELILNYNLSAQFGRRKVVPFSVQGVAAGSGLEGNVSATPTKPVARPGEKDTRPVAGALVIVEDENGKEVGRTTTDAKGNFKVALPAGKYKVTARFPNQKAAFPMPTTREVTVPKQGFEKLELTLDTGIRMPPVRPKNTEKSSQAEFNIEIDQKLRINGEPE